MENLQTDRNEGAVLRILRLKSRTKLLFRLGAILSVLSLCGVIISSQPELLPFPPQPKDHATLNVEFCEDARQVTFWQKEKEVRFGVLTGDVSGECLVKIRIYGSKSNKGPSVKLKNNSDDIGRTVAFTKTKNDGGGAVLVMYEGEILLNSNDRIVEIGNINLVNYYSLTELSVGYGLFLHVKDIRKLLTMDADIYLPPEYRVEQSPANAVTEKAISNGEIYNSVSTAIYYKRGDDESKHVDVGSAFGDVEWLSAPEIVVIVTDTRVEKILGLATILFSILLGVSVSVMLESYLSGLHGEV